MLVMKKTIFEKAKYIHLFFLEYIYNCENKSQSNSLV